jgi:hypothetical protein
VFTNVPDEVSNEISLSRQRWTVRCGEDTHRNVLDSVKSETICSSLLEDPLAPFPMGQQKSRTARADSLDLIGNFRVRVID